MANRLITPDEFYRHLGAVAQKHVREAQRETAAELIASLPINDKLKARLLAKAAKDAAQMQADFEAGVMERWMATQPKR